MHSGPQTWWQVPLQEEPSPQPHLSLFTEKPWRSSTNVHDVWYCVKIRDSSASLRWSYHSFNKPNNHCVVRKEGQRGAQRTPCNDGVYCHVACRAWARESLLQTPLALTPWSISSWAMSVPHSTHVFRMCYPLPMPALRPVFSHPALALLLEVSRPFQADLLLWAFSFLPGL